MKTRIKKNLCIFCFYNRNGIVSEYVYVLLEHLKSVSARLIFVANGVLNDTGKSRVSDYTNEIIVRENVGRDYGAYRDIIVGYIGNEQLRQYENVILCNDTFLGFFRPFKDIFLEMQNKDGDLWGIDRVHRGILDHIQSYLLVFRKKIISDNSLWNYFESNEIEDDSFGETGALIETKLYRHFKESGYKLDSYIYTDHYSIYASPYECVTQYGLPIIKKKSFLESVCSKDNLKNAISFVVENRLYNNEIIEKEPFRDAVVESPPTERICDAIITEADLINFSSEKFYIFGAGLVAKEIYYTYFKNNKNFCGFVVSEPQNDTFFSIKDIRQDANIILGVNYKIQREVINIIPNTMNKLVIWE